MQTIKYSKNKDWQKILQRPAIDSSSLEKKVNKILNEVKRKGDKAIKKFTEEFGGIKLKNFSVTESEFKEVEKLVSNELKNAIIVAKNNIEKFHLAQVQSPEIIETMPGIKCWRKNMAIEKVGLYIPGGTAPLFSTLLMLGIPALIAGCKEIIVCSPPDKKGKLHPAILFVAQLLNIKTVFKIGGVQAIGAMTYGTETVPAVYKIFGPGNQFITCAKQLIQKVGVAIDMPAGPSEVAIFADETADVSFVTADLLSQAEHGVDSHVILVTNSENLSRIIKNELKNQLEKLPRKEIAKRSLEKSKIILVKNDSEAMQILNEYAPEHLILSCKNAAELSDKVINAGSVFLGSYSPESVGDYASGTNHTLPTNGYAKSYSGVSVDSFVKKITFQQLSRQGLTEIAKTVEIMAEAEGLSAHAEGVRIRLNQDLSDLTDSSEKSQQSKIKN
ncbi:MAG TPA: histidinol dehydrogenase [Puia sp.]|jgi:histidinol dehydrogenase|nr:histidinol dehydrogenase [Puia sp.]